MAARKRRSTKANADKTAEETQQDQTPEEEPKGEESGDEKKGEGDEQPEKARPPKIEKFERDLKVPLTPEELQELSDESAKLMWERDQMLEDLSAHSKSVKSKVATADARMREIASETRARHTWKTIDCERVFDWTEKVVREVRLDTGEEIDVRGMRNHELQAELDFQKKDDDEGDLDDEFPEDPEDDSSDEDPPPPAGDEDPGPPSSEDEDEEDAAQ